MMDFEIHACTDVTGFGLLGHLREMAVGSGLDVALDFDQIPLLPGARALAAANVVPGGSLDNLEHVAPHVDWSDGRSHIDKVLLADAQTSGGLLVSLAMDQVDSFLTALGDLGVESAARIGRFGADGSGRITV